MRLLDLFCGAGGAAMGYHRAGFEVVGVDIREQPRYPFEFHCADALEFPLDGFKVVHASPPCQAYVQWNTINRLRGKEPRSPDLVGQTRHRLADWRYSREGVAYVIENVVGAPLHRPLMLCGSLFGLGVQRHRLFECSHVLFSPGSCRHGESVGVYGKLDGRRLYTRADGTEQRCAATIKEGQAAMGIDWMEWKELTQAIPPAYTEYIGKQLQNSITGEGERE